MASIIKLKRSAVPSSVPSTLQEGEIAVNIVDKKLYVGGVNGGANVQTLSGDQYNLTSVNGSDSATITLTVDNDVLSNDSITFSAGEGIDISESSGTITIAGENASDTNKGVASFNSGDFKVTSGDVQLADTLAIGNTGITGTLDVSGLASLDGGIDVDGAFTVADTTGNIDTTGTLNVDGATTLNALTITTLTANGIATFVSGVDAQSTLNVDGDTTLNGVTITTMTANGAVTINGLASLDGGIDVDGAFTVADSTGNIDTTGTLNVDGATTLNGLTVTTLTANGTATFSGLVDINNDADISGQLNIGENLVVSGNTSIAGDLIVDGNLTVEGAVTYISSSTVNVDDSMLKLSANNAADTVDTGVYGLYIEAATNKFSGYFRDATDGVFKFYTGLEAEPTTTVNTGGTGYAIAQVDAIIDGGSY